MIEAREFIQAAADRNFSFYTGVPCSYLKPFINYVIDAPGLEYLVSANEGDAVATAAGAALAGNRAVAMMQNSGLGNAVSPLTSLNWVFRLPVLLVITWRGMPGMSDEPQHELMGRVTQHMLETMDIPWEFFPEYSDSVEAVLDRACRHMDQVGRPYALVMKKGSVASCPLQDNTVPSAGQSGLPDRRESGDTLMSRHEALAEIQARTAVEDSVVIASTGFNGRELFALDDRANQLYMVGSMGCAASFGLGLSKMREDLEVVVVDGDGASLMRMGNIASIGAYGGARYNHILLDNEVHDSTGGQSTVSGGVDFAAVAAACGYGSCFAGQQHGLIATALAATRKPSFLHLKIRPGAKSGLPRPDLAPARIKSRLMQHIGADAPWRDA